MQDVDDLIARNSTLLEENTKLRQQLATAKRAIEYYADEYNWRDDGEWDWIWKQNEVDYFISDPVEYARATLKKLEGDE